MTVLTDRADEQKLHIDTRDCRCDACYLKAQRLVIKRLRADLRVLASDARREPAESRTWFELLEMKRKVLAEYASHDYQTHHRQPGTGRMRAGEAPGPPEKTIAPKGDTHPTEHTVTLRQHKDGQEVGFSPVPDKKRGPKRKDQADDEEEEMVDVEQVAGP